MSADGPARARLGRRITVAVIVLVLWGLITHGTYAGSGDEPHYAMIMHSIVFDRDIDLTNNYGDPRVLVFGGKLEPERHAIVGTNGRLRPVHDIGMPLMFAPYYALAYPLAEWLAGHAPHGLLERTRLNGPVILRHLLSLGMIAVTVLIGLRLYDVFFDMTGVPARAASWTLLFTLSPPLLSHSFLFFTEIVSAWMTLVIWMTLRDRMPTTRSALLAGSLTGYLLLVHVRNVGLVAALLVLGVRRCWRAQPRTGPLVSFMTAALVFIGIRTLVNYEFWGTWIMTPHARAEWTGGASAMAAETAARLLGWLFDQEHGLLAYAPIYLLTLPGLVFLWKRSREWCAELIFVLAAYVGPMAVPLLNPHGWRGGWSPAARFLVPVVPLLATAAFFAITRLGRLPITVRALVALQVLLNIVVWQHPKLLWNDGSGASSLLQFFAGGSRWLADRAPSMDLPWSSRTMVGVACASMGWVMWTAWLIRRSPGGSLARPHSDEASILDR
ncbi:MAG: hypothetical protein NTV05_14845 [Acidobacteria bacterium]|nr:hypothetical protein [Acidobacteriota bacterium]